MQDLAESRVMERLVAVVGGEGDLSAMLDTSVELIVEATASKACFVYLAEGAKLRLAAASGDMSQMVNRVVVDMTDGLTGWAARTATTGLIRHDVLSDPRTASIPGLPTRIESMLAVPMAPAGDQPFGVLVLFSEVSHEFDDATLTFMDDVAPLLALGIQNRRLAARAGHQLDSLTKVSSLCELVSSMTSRQELYRAIVEGLRVLLDCEATALTVWEYGVSGVVASDPPGSVPTVIDPKSGVARIQLTRDTEALSVPITIHGESVGETLALRDQAFSPDQEQLVRIIATHVAVALKRIELLERQTNSNIGRELFGALARQEIEPARLHARSLGMDLADPFVALEVRPSGSADSAWLTTARAVERALRRAKGRVVIDLEGHRLRAIVSLTHGAGESQRVVEMITEFARADELHVGFAQVASGSDHASIAVAQADDACTVASALLPQGGVLDYDDLGAYKYVVRLTDDEVPDSRYADAISAIEAYDERRNAELLRTLEEYFNHLRSPTTTARALFIHPNTLRQRLERIETLTGISIDQENVASLELATKLARLRGGLRRRARG